MVVGAVEAIERSASRAHRGRSAGSVTDRRRFVIVVRLRPDGGADRRPGTEGDDEDGPVGGELGR